jgi:hypothetical protein
MRGERARLSRHAEVAKAMDYMLSRWEVFTRIPQMDWRSVSLVHRFPLVGQDLTPDQVAES